MAKTIKLIIEQMEIYIEIKMCCKISKQIPYVPPILGQLLDLISPPKINISEPRFGLYDSWDLAK